MKEAYPIIDNEQLYSIGNNFTVLFVGKELVAVNYRRAKTEPTILRRRGNGFKNTEEFDFQNMKSIAETGDFDGELEEESGEVLEKLPDNVSIYLQEASRIPLLSVVEEITLAKTIEAGVQASQKLHLGDNPDDGIAHLNRKVQDGIDARDHFVRANLRLVVSIARRYMGRGLTLLDLIQEGNIGMMHAVDKFDYKKGFKFSTYATWWIKQGISRAIADQSRTIRLPVHMNDGLKTAYDAIEEYYKETGKWPMNENLLPGLIKERLTKSNKTSPESIAATYFSGIAKVPLSFDKLAGDSDSDPIIELIEDKEVDVVSEAVNNASSEKLREYLKNLTPRKRRILELRFGLDGEGGKILEQIGDELGFTRERIRQIAIETLDKLGSDPDFRRKFGNEFDGNTRIVGFEPPVVKSDQNEKEKTKDRQTYDYQTVKKTVNTILENRYLSGKFSDEEQTILSACFKTGFKINIAVDRLAKIFGVPREDMIKKVRLLIIKSMEIEFNLLLTR